MSDFAVKAILAVLDPHSGVSREVYRKLYLQTEHWRAFRIKAHAHYKGVCATCGRYTPIGQANIHHLRYFDERGSILFRESYADVRVTHRGKCHARADQERKKALRRG